MTLDELFAELEALASFEDRVRMAQEWLTSQPEEVRVLEGPAIMSSLTLMGDEIIEI